MLACTELAGCSTLIVYMCTSIVSCTYNTCTYITHTGPYFALRIRAEGHEEAGRIGATEGCEQRVHAGVYKGMNLCVCVKEAFVPTACMRLICTYMRALVCVY